MAQDPQMLRAINDYLIKKNVDCIVFFNYFRAFISDMLNAKYLVFSTLNTNKNMSHVLLIY